MRLITYSDLHLEFGSDWMPPDVDGDILILAGDIISFKDYGPLDRLLRFWRKPVLYVPGNHEYYTSTPMDLETARFVQWLNTYHPHVTALLDEEITVGGVHFFGGPMWTDFQNGNPLAMHQAIAGMNDFRLIVNPDGSGFQPSDAMRLHERFVARLLAWLAKDVHGPRVVISHHAPVINPRTKYRGSPLWPAFNSLDMVPVVEQYQPALWIYGHTHECDAQWLGNTRILSNQLGYPLGSGRFECDDFDPRGVPIDLA